MVKGHKRRGISFSKVLQTRETLKNYLSEIANTLMTAFSYGNPPYHSEDILWFPLPKKCRSIYGSIMPH